MSAQQTYDFAPLGSIVRYSDGTPMPPARHTRKRALWETTNNTGRLIRKQPGMPVPGSWSLPSYPTKRQA